MLVLCVALCLSFVIMVCVCRVCACCFCCFLVVVSSALFVHGVVFLMLFNIAVRKICCCFLFVD